MIRIIREMAGYLRGDRPPPLEDPVVWTIRSESLQKLLDQMGFAQAHEPGWDIVDGSLCRHQPPLPKWSGKLRRTDGKYRWRDDGFAGL